MATGNVNLTIADGGACDVAESPWILACGFDAAGEMLKHLYDGLAAPSGELTGALREFGQSRYVGDSRLASMAKTGFVFVPDECAAGAPCRMTVLSARSPASRLSAPSRMLLPAPVSPVTAVKPASKSSDTSSSSARFRIRSDCNMTR